MQNFEPYVRRPLAFLGQHNAEDWRIKAYAVSAKLLPLPEDMVSEGIKYVMQFLPQPALTKSRYGVGFLIIHQGTMRNWYLLDWWEDGDIIHHQLFSSPLDNPGSITAEPDKSLIACVHELRIINFESEAWIKTILCSEAKPSFENYLSSHMDSSESNVPS